MTIDDALRLIGAIAISFGGGATVVVGLSGWLADLWAKRALQREHTQLQRWLEEVKHELSFEKSSYERVLSLVLDYYEVFYRHYRLCQRTASMDAWQQAGEEAVKETKEEFFEKLGAFLSDWAEQESRVRLLLPLRLLELHGESIDCFNDFKSAVQAFRKDDVTRKAKEDAFAKIENVKVQMEQGLREYLRIDKLLK